MNLSTCADSACVEGWLRSHPGVQGEELARQIASIPDPIRQEDAVKTLFQVNSDSGGKVCGGLKEPVKGACMRMSDRPHLYRVAVPAANGGSAAPAWASSGWTCDAACREKHLAADPRAAEVQAKCAGLSEGKWKDECYFQASDLTFNPERPDTIRTSATLCMASGSYVYDCLFHISSRVVGLITPERLMDEARWRYLDRTTRQVVEAFGAIDPSLAQQAEDLVWARVAEQAYDEMARPTGLPLEWVSAGATRHIRAKVARSLWEEGASRGGLAEWTAAVGTVMASRDTVPLRSTPPQHDGRAAWFEVLPEETSLPRVTWFLIATRTWSEDPEVDAAICVIEAATRSRNPDEMKVVADGLRHPNRRVRWTTARLVEELHVVVPEGTLPADDPDPLVRERLLRIHPAQVAPRPGPTPPPL